MHFWQWCYTVHGEAKSLQHVKPAEIFAMYMCYVIHIKVQNDKGFRQGVYRRRLRQLTIGDIKVTEIVETLECININIPNRPPLDRNSLKHNLKIRIWFIGAEWRIYASVILTLFVQTMAYRQCWNIADWTLGNKSHWNFDWNLIITWLCGFWQKMASIFP